MRPSELSSELLRIALLVDSSSSPSKMNISNHISSLIHNLSATDDEALVMLRRMEDGDRKKRKDDREKKAKAEDDKKEQKKEDREKKDTEEKERRDKTFEKLSS